jgi:hypothetical protein
MSILLAIGDLMRAGAPLAPRRCGDGERGFGPIVGEWNGSEI